MSIAVLFAATSCTGITDFSCMNNEFMSLQSRLRNGCKMIFQLWNFYCMFVRMNITHRPKFTSDYQTNASLLKPHTEFHYGLHAPLLVSAPQKQGVCSSHTKSSLYLWQTWNYSRQTPCDRLRLASPSTPPKMWLKCFVLCWTACLGAAKLGRYERRGSDLTCSVLVM